MTSLDLIIGQFELQTRLFNNVLDGMDADHNTRPTSETNHIAWLAGHLVSSRYTLVNLLDGSKEEPHPGIFAQGTGIDNSLTYPSRARCLADWKEVTPLLMEALGQADEAALSAKSPIPTPMGEKLGEGIAFFAHHEGYHIGQAGILRYRLGYDHGIV